MRRARETVDLVSDDEASIPTPAASLDLTSKANGEDGRNSSSENEPVRSNQRTSTRSKRPKQQRLDFNNARDPSSFDSPVRLQSTARVESSNQAGMFSSQVHGQVGGFEGEESSDGSDELPSPRKLLKASKTGKKSTRRSKRKGGEQKSTSIPAVVADEEVDDDEIVVVGNRRRLTPPQHEEDSGDDSDMPTTQRRRRARPSQSIRASSGSPTYVDNDEDDDDTDMPTTQGRQQRKTKRARRNSFISDSPPPVDDSDDDVVMIQSRKRARPQSDDEDDGEDEDELPKTPGRRGLKRHRKELTQREKEDLEEDLDFLGPSDNDAPSSGRAPRSTQSAQKSAKQQALDKIRRLRAGQEAIAEEEKEDEDEDESEEQNSDDGELAAEDYVVGYPSSRQIFQERDEDAEFIEASPTMRTSLIHTTH